jgi:hypothetical protein
VINFVPLLSASSARWNKKLHTLPMGVRDWSDLCMIIRKKISDWLNTRQIFDWSIHLLPKKFGSQFHTHQRMITSIKRKISTPSTSPEKKNKTSTEERTAEVQNLQSLDIGEFYTSQEDPSQTTQATDPIASLEHKEKTSAFLEEFNFEKLISKEEDFIKKQEDKISQENKHLYDLYNDLQGLAQEYSLNLKVPEIVVVGMQSDGKSSFVEALLGFQFNTIETRTSVSLIFRNWNSQTTYSSNDKRSNCRDTDLYLLQGRSLRP